jgi:hypothetical protein
MFVSFYMKPGPEDPLAISYLPIDTGFPMCGDISARALNES